MRRADAAHPGHPARDRDHRADPARGVGRPGAHPRLPAHRRRRRPLPARGSTTCSTSPPPATCRPRSPTSTTTASPRSSTADGRVLAASPNIEGRPPITDFDPGAELAVRTVDGPDDDETETYRLWAGTGDQPRRPGHGLRRDQPRVGARGVSHPAPLALRRRARWSCCCWPSAPGWCWAGRCAGWTGSGPRSTPSPRTGWTGGCPSRTWTTRWAARRHDEPDARPARDARARQREFVADVSHDLQSPLAAQRTELEVARAHPESHRSRPPRPPTCSPPTPRWSTWSGTCSSSPPPTPAPRRHPRRRSTSRTWSSRRPSAARAGGRVRVDTTARLRRAGVRQPERRSSGSCATCSTTRSPTPTPGRAARERRGRTEPASTSSTTAPACARANGTGSSSASTAATRPGPRHTRGSGLGLAIARTLAERNGGGLELADTGTRRALRPPLAGGRWLGSRRMALPIEDYALIGDRHTAALVGRDGSVDWLCLPRFDSPACFAALLGTEEHGRWQLCPAGEYTSTRRYLDQSTVLETTFRTATGDGHAGRPDAHGRLAGRPGPPRHRRQGHGPDAARVDRPHRLRRGASLGPPTRPSAASEVITATAGPDTAGAPGAAAPVGLRRPSRGRVRRRARATS